MEEQGGGGYPGDLASQRARGQPQHTGPGDGPLGLAFLESDILVPRDLMTRVVG